jgi:hypothetical protein
MRRSLVLTDETARHPFRASLPAHVREYQDEIEPRVSWRRRLSLNDEDLRAFLLTYCACFLAVTTFLI